MKNWLKRRATLSHAKLSHDTLSYEVRPTRPIAQSGRSIQQAQVWREQASQLPFWPLAQAGTASYLQFYRLPPDMQVSRLPLGHDQDRQTRHIHILSARQQATHGTVWVLHGYLEHAALYGRLYQQLLAAGFAVVALELPGHGLSSGAATAITDFGEYQDMLQQVMQLADSSLPRPWLGVGQSTGAGIWMEYLLQMARQQQEPQIERALLLSPLVRPARSAWWHNPTGLAVMRRIKPQVPRYFRRNNANPEYLRFIRLQDPLQPRLMSMQWVTALYRWMDSMDRHAGCRFPVWVIQGRRDRTVDWQYNLDYIRSRFRLINTLLLEEGSHQIINERDDIRAAADHLIAAFLSAE